MDDTRRGPAASDKSEVPLEFNDVTAWAAWLYFVDEMTQSEVAKAIGVSRVTVIKLLNEAKEKGLVSVRIDPTLASRVTTARRFAERFGLNSVFVIPDNPDKSLTDRLGIAGRHLLLKGLAAGDVIGVAWGRTVLHAVEDIRLETPIENLTVVQVAASANGLSADFSPELCVSLCANNLGARSVSLMAPALLSSPELRAMLLNEPSIRNQMDVIRSANKVLFGVGQLDADATLRTSEIHSGATIDKMIRSGAVGAVLGRFLAQDGNELAGPTHDRMIGLSLDELRDIPQRICLAGGLYKKHAILASLRGGFVTDLVIDLPTAQALMAEVE
ncbi:MAG: sugar-binding transcriptional regulator [Pseudomonadota bacterium]